MISTVEKTINGSRYSITQMTAWKALQMQTRLFKIVGPAFSEQDKFFDKIAQSLSEKEIESLFWDLIFFSSVRKDGMELNKATIDIEFAGDTGSLFKLIMEIVEVNYGDFLDKSGIGSLLGITRMTHKTDK
jgi:hypothetical protein